MADESIIYQTFRKAHCERLDVTSDPFPLAKSVSSKIRDCMKGKRTRLPFSFAKVYPGDGKRKIGLSIFLERVKGNDFRIFMRWFITDADPPNEFGKVSDLFACLAPGFGQRAVDVAATFKYSTARMSSLFRPIQLDAISALFDEIVGFTGVKKDTEGKLVYIMNVALGKKELTHVVQFTQVIEMTEELPQLLIPKAGSISSLALEGKGEK